MEKINTKNLSGINITKDICYLNYRKRDKIYGDLSTTIQIKTPFQIYERQIEKKKFNWSNICLFDSIVKIFPKIIKIEIWYENNKVKDKDITKDTVVIYTKDLTVSFDQWHIDGQYWDNHDCSLVKEL